MRGVCATIFEPPAVAGPPGVSGDKGVRLGDKDAHYICSSPSQTLTTSNNKLIAPGFLAGIRLGLGLGLGPGLGLPGLRGPEMRTTSRRTFAPGASPLVSGGWCKEAGVRRLVSEGWCQEAGVRRLVSGGWCQEAGVRRLD